MQTTNWSITINPDAREYVGENTVTDTLTQIANAPTRYSGAGIKVEIYDNKGNLVKTLTPTWNDLSEFKEDSSWKYQLPGDGNTPYKYVISYTTETDTSKIKNSGTILNNTATDGNGGTASGSVAIDPGSDFGVKKQHVNASKTEVDWTVTVTIPEDGFNNSFNVTDSLPTTWKNGWHADSYKEGSMTVKYTTENGANRTLQQNVDYTLNIRKQEQNICEQILLDFKNVGQLFPEVSKGTERTLTLSYKTIPDPEWPSSENHSNTVKVIADDNEKSADDTYKLSDYKIEKKFDGQGTEDNLPIFRFNIYLEGVDSDSIEIADVFNADIFKVYEGDNEYAKPRVGGGDTSWDAENNGNQASKANGGSVEMSVTQGSSGAIFKLHVNKKSEGVYYNWYCLKYALQVKDQDALRKLEQMAADATNHKAVLNNRASWGDVSTNDITWEYTLSNPVTKSITKEANSSDGYKAYFEIEINKEKLKLNGGNTIDLNDVLAVSGKGAKIQLLPETVKFEIDPNSNNYSWDYSEDLMTLTAKIPDESHVKIAYQAKVIGKGKVNYNNTVNISGSYTASTDNKTVTISSSAEGTSEIFEYTIVKKDAETKAALAGAVFSLSEKQNDGTWKELPVKFTTGSDGTVTIKPGNETVTGWHLYKNHIYKLEEIIAPENYEKAAPIIFKAISRAGTDVAGSDGKYNGESIYVYDHKATRVSASVDLKATKILKGRDLKANEFYFTLTPDENNTNDMNGVQIKPNDAAGNIKFDSLQFTNVGNYIYTIVETDNKENGVIYDKTQYRVIIEVKVNNEGDLTASKSVKKIVKGEESNDSQILFSNIYETPTININGSKTWDDNNNQDGNRPSSITVKLLANGTKVASKEVTARDNWKYSFTDLPKYENGTAINYTVTEDAVADYSTTINGYDIINTYTPGQTSVTVTKAWVDNDNKSNKRPSGINVQLYAGKQKSGNPVTLNEENKWTYTWNGLDEKKNGTTIAYTVKEDGTVEGYEASVSGNACTGYTITNTLKLGTLEIVKSITGDISDSELTSEQRAKITFTIKGPEQYSKTVTYNEFTDGKYTFQNLPLGEYTVTETNADMEGYKLTTTYSVDGGKVTVTNEKTANITITNDYTKILVKISKVDATNQKELEGAHIQIVDKDGKVVDKWTSGKEPHVVNNLKPGETYTLRETVAPNGYYLKADTTFTLKADGSIDKKNTTTTISEEGILLVEDTAIPTPDVPSGPTVKISKVDVTSQQELEGAKLQVIDKNGNVVDEWISGKTAHVTTELKAGETYTLRETVAPDGYLITSDTTFTLKEDGTVDESKTTTKVKDGVLLVEDTKAVSVNISKVDATNQKELEGAHIQIVDKDGKIVDEWTSGKEPHVVKNLKPGETYTLRETVAPDGYTVTSDTTFTLKEDGTVDQTKTTATVSDKGVVLVEDNMTSVSISKVDITSQKELAGAHIQILDKDGNVVEEWDSTDKAYTIKGLKTGETYTLRETVAPKGYKVAEDTTFQLNEDGTIDTANTTTAISDDTLLVKDEKKESKDVSVSVTKKLVTVDGTVIGAVDATYYVALYSDADCTQRVSDVLALNFKNASASTVTFTGLEKGQTYYVGECEADGTCYLANICADGTMYMVDFSDGNAVTVDNADGSTTVYFDNQFEKIPDGYYKEAELNITKKLVGSDGKAKNSNEIFYAGIFADEGFTQLSTDVSQNIVPLDLAGGSEATALVNVALPESGSITLYVTEVDSNGKPVAGAASFKYDVTVDNAQVTLNDDNLSANVVITNTENSTKVTPTPGTPNTPNTPNTTGGFSGKSAVRTGDSTPIGGFIALFAAAAVIAGVAVFFKRRRKDEK